MSAVAPKPDGESLPAAAEKVARDSLPNSVQLRSSRLSFLRSDRLTSRRQYRAVYDQGRRVRGGCVTLFALPNKLHHCRVGLTVTKRLGNAVARNRVKRTLRELFRTNRLWERGAIDIVVNAHPSIHHKSNAEIESDLLQCFQRILDRPGVGG